MQLATTPSPLRPSLSVRPDLTLFDSERWHVAHTQPRRELSAQAHLSNQGFRTFLPRYEKTTGHARKVERKIAPLFPRYLFVILDLDRDPWHAVNGTYGVTGLVMGRDRPLSVTKGVIETLIASSSAAGDVQFEDELSVGQTVRMVKGPFADQLGILHHLDDRRRVCVLLQMMGAAVPIQMPRSDVIPFN